MGSGFLRMASCVMGLDSRPFPIVSILKRVFVFVFTNWACVGLTLSRSYCSGPSFTSIHFDLTDICFASTSNPVRSDITLIAS